MGCDWLPQYWHGSVVIFQSTHPSGVRPPVTFCNRVWYDISIHAPQWGATATPLGTSPNSLFQSTHPSGVRPGGQGSNAQATSISIHAPQWGATVLGTSRFPWVSYFNPRTPVGCDTIPRGDAGTAGVFQSTHPSGVRLSVQTATSVDFLFQSTHPSGVRLSAFLLAASLSRFQSTHPSGVRLKPQRIVRARPGFQSTHPSGVRRLRCPSELPTEPISIHAPQWGATLPQYWHGSVVIFQSTHPSGVRPPGRPVLTARSHFNPRTPVGCDRSCSFEYSFAVISIHAPQWGATRPRPWRGPCPGYCFCSIGS